MGLVVVRAECIYLTATALLLHVVLGRRIFLPIMRLRRTILVWLAVAVVLRWIGSCWPALVVSLWRLLRILLVGLVVRPVVRLGRALWAAIALLRRILALARVVIAVLLLSAVILVLAVALLRVAILAFRWVLCHGEDVL